MLLDVSSSVTQYCQWLGRSLATTLAAPPHLRVGATQSRIDTGRPRSSSSARPIGTSVNATGAGALAAANCRIPDLCDARRWVSPSGATGFGGVLDFARRARVLPGGFTC